MCKCFKITVFVKFVHRKLWLITNVRYSLGTRNRQHMVCNGAMNVGDNKEFKYAKHYEIPHSEQGY